MEWSPLKVFAASSATERKFISRQSIELIQIKHQEYVDSNFTWENFTIEEQDKSGQILNFLGAAKMLKGPKNKTTIKSAIINFKESFKLSFFYRCFFLEDFFDFKVNVL